MSVWKKWRGWIIPLFIFSGSVLLMDSCMQFRMSKSEIDQYFSNKATKGTLHHYKVNDRTMYYVAAGDSLLPLVVFVHGSPGSLSAFIDFLADTSLLAHAQLITADRPGFGLSNFGRAEPSLQKQAACLKPILEGHKKQRPIILVGHSLGGPLIARMAMDYPELVDAIVLVAPSIDPDLEPNEWYRAPFATPFLRWMLPRSIRASNDEIYRLKPELEEMLPLWSTVHAKTIVIQGKEDSLVPKENAAFAEKMIKDAPLKINLINDVDHFIPWSHPKLITNEILGLLTEPNKQRH